MNDLEIRKTAISKADTKGINRNIIDSFCDPQKWKQVYNAILFDALSFKPDRQGFVEKKDKPGEFREVSIGCDESRILMAIITEVCFRLFGKEMIHHTSKAYQKGLSCGKSVIEASNAIVDFMNNHWNHYHYFTSGDIKKKKKYAVKIDFSKYFDKVFKEKIFEIFARIEKMVGFEFGTEQVMNLLRRTYMDDRFILKDGTEEIRDRGLRQGNAFASFLANVILYDVDEYMSQNYEYYVRYSDDVIVLTMNPEKAKYDIARLVAEYGVSINPNKVQDIVTGEWFTFLGFSLRENGMRTLSKNRFNTFKREIRERTVNADVKTTKKAINNVYKYMYKGDGEYSFATSVLPVINSSSDIDMMNRYVMDCIRGSVTKKRTLWGLGYDRFGVNGVIPFEKGTNVKQNRDRIPRIEGYDTISFWKKLLANSRSVYNARIRLI